VDLVENIYELCLKRGISHEISANIAKSIRNDFGGTLTYIPKYPSQLHESIARDLIRSSDAKSLARKHEVSVSTVRRIMRRGRRRGKNGVHNNAATGIRRGNSGRNT